MYPANMRFIDSDSWRHDLLASGHMAKVVTRSSSVVYSFITLQNKRPSILQIPTKANPNTIGDLMATWNRTVVGETDSMTTMFRAIGLEFNLRNGRSPGRYFDHSGVLYIATSDSSGGGLSGVTINMKIKSDENNAYPNPEDYANSLKEATGFQDIIPVALLGS